MTTKKEDAPTTDLAPVETQQYVQEWWNPTTFEQAMQMAEMMAKTNVIPNSFRGRPGDILVAWSLGAPMGLTALSCLRHIAVINGLPQIWGDAALAICRAHPVCEWIQETQDGEGDEIVSTCRVKRRGDPMVIERTFSVADAKQAGLWGRKSKGGEAMPWTAYPKRMLQMRARGFALRDAFPDALCGMPIVEEMRDITDQTVVRGEAAQEGSRTDQLKRDLGLGASADEEGAGSGSAEPEAPEATGETPEGAQASTEPPAASGNKSGKGKKAAAKATKPPPTRPAAEVTDAETGEAYGAICESIGQAGDGDDLNTAMKEIRSQQKAGVLDKAQGQELMALVHERGQKIAKRTP